MMSEVFLFLFGYLSGSVIFGELIARSKGINLREVGSGNVGATNVGRALGKKYALIVFLLDMLKGFIPVVVAGLWTGWGSWGVAFAGSGSVSGHMYPLFFGFRGGKGVATAFGVVLGISWKIALLLAVIWALVLGVTRYVSVASMVASFSAVPLFLFADYPLPLVVLSIICAVLIIYRHIPNIQRLMSGNEPKI
jgi:glycerol-3-phosphate acyltransferase PlsY